MGKPNLRSKKENTVCEILSIIERFLKFLFILFETFDLINNPEFRIPLKSIHP